jgi:hypothetical protein
MQDALIPKYSDQDFQFVAVHVGFDPAVAMQELEEAGVTVPVVFDLESEVFRRLRAPDWAFPVHIVIDRDGKIAFIQTEDDLDALDAAIEAVIG